LVAIMALAVIVTAPTTTAAPENQTVMRVAAGQSATTNNTLVSTAWTESAACPTAEESLVEATPDSAMDEWTRPAVYINGADEEFEQIATNLGEQTLTATGSTAGATSRTETVGDHSTATVTHSAASARPSSVSAIHIQEIDGADGDDFAIGTNSSATASLAAQSASTATIKGANAS
jgi:hypothetical protein